MRICIVNLTTNIVENVAEMGVDLPPNASQPSTPPAGYAWIQHATAARGWVHNNGVLSDPTPPAPPPPVPSGADLTAACIAGTSTPPAPGFAFDLQRAFIAHVVSCEAYRLGVAPGALTGAQLQAIRNRVAAIYQAL